MDIFSPTIIDNAIITGSNNASLLQVSSPSAASAFFISGSGRVGIGTTSPLSTLTVEGGNINIGAGRGIGGNFVGTYTSFITYHSDGLGFLQSASFGFRGSAYMDSIAYPDLFGFGTNDLRFFTSTNGIAAPSEIMRMVGSTGFVGIGETSPSAKLEIRGSGATSATTALRVENSSAVARLTILDDGTSAFNTSHLYVSSSGRVGIGTTTPRELLHVAGGNIALDASRYIDWGSGNSRITDLGLISGQGYPITISTFGPIAAGAPNSLSEKLRLTGSGSLGLGTTNPLARLHVSGSDGNDFLRVTSGSQNILNIRSGSAVFFAGTGVAPTSGFDLDIQGTGTAFGGSVRIAGNGTNWEFKETSLVQRTSTGNNEMFGVVMGGNANTGIQNPLRVQFNANQTSTAGYTVLRLNATHTAVGTGNKLLQTWEFGGNAQSVIDISGSLGIGTGSAPNARLFVSGANADALFRVSSPSATNALFVSGSGNVGIGTATPSTTLQVAGTSSLQNIVFDTNNTYDIGTITTRARNIWSNGIIAAQNSYFTSAVMYNSARIGGEHTATALLHISGSDSAQMMRINSPTNANILFVSGSGNVGIGTNLPSAELHISGASIDSPGGNVGIQTTADYWIHLSTDPGGGKHLNIDAAQSGNPPADYTPSGGNTVNKVVGTISDSNVLGTPDYWMEIRLGGTTVLIPCYTPTP